MALFGGKKKNTEEKKDTGTKTVATVSVGKNYENILTRPRITEKAALGTDTHVYTFDVAPKATKTEVKKAVVAAYKVTPIRVNMVAIPKKTVRSRRGKTGMKGGGKKAYVYLKKGDKIDLM